MKLTVDARNMSGNSRPAIRRMAVLMLSCEAGEALFHVGDGGLQLWVGVLPEVDELVVVGHRVSAVPACLIELAQATVGWSEVDGVLVVPVEAGKVDEATIDGERRI